MIEVILVDESDTPVGKMEKLAAHQQGLMHRAITVYIFNSSGELLLQQRALSKYHCGGRWSNTCCGHPYPGELTQAAAERRLHEEMGLKLSLTPIFRTSYCLKVTDNLIEHEFGHIFFGLSDQAPQPNPDEAHDYSYRSMDRIAAEIEANPRQFTPWFQKTFPEIQQYLSNFLQLAES